MFLHIGALMFPAVLVMSITFGRHYDKALCHCYPRIYKSVMKSLDVMQSPGFEMVNCNKVRECRNLCQEVFEALGNGNLTYEMINGQTVGDMLCEALAHKNVSNIQRKTVHVYSKVCKRSKQYIGKRSERNALCCASGKFHSCGAHVNSILKNRNNYTIDSDIF